MSHGVVLDNTRYTCMYPPSANWYCAKVSDWNNKGLFAFGTKNSVLLLDVNTRKFVGNLAGHTNKISAVCFNKHEPMSNICVTGSADKSVRVWDYTTLSCKASHTIHKNEVNAVSLSPITSDLVVSGDKDGTIVVWRTVSDEKHTMSPINFPVYCIACSPVSGNEAAIGYANGMVLVANVVTGSVLHKLGGHTDEVHALSWSIDLSYSPASSSSWNAPSSPASPSSPAPASSSEEPKIEVEKSESTADASSESVPRHYLASSSRDKTIRIWEGWGVYRCHKELYLPKAPGNMTEQQKGRVWLTVDFSLHNPFTLVSSSHAGDILSWNLKDKSPAPHRFSSGHTRSVFNLHHSAAHPRQLISISMDRQIVCWDLKTSKTTWRIPGLGGFVYSLDVSPLDPSRVALAVGDNTVRVWITNSRDDLYDSILLWKGIQSKVSVVSYHPTEIGILGYGLEDGRTQFSGGHRGTVYEISWRVQSDTTALMYSCGDGIVYEWNTSDFKKVDQAPKNINTYIEAANPDMPPYAPKRKFPSRSDAVWNHAGTLLAIGNGDGLIELFDSSFKLLKRFTDHRKLINRIRWHPVPHKANIFATASDDGSIRVYDINSLVSGKSTDDSVAISGSAECIQVMKHEQQVSSVAWSPHEADLLISGSFDGTAQVWNAVTGQAIANIRGHEGRIFTVGWSPLHPRIVFTAGDDQSARMWDYTTQPDQAPPAGKPTKQKKKGDTKDSEEPAATKAEVASAGKPTEPAKEQNDTIPQQSSDLPSTPQPEPVKQEQIVKVVEVKEEIPRPQQAPKPDAESKKKSEAKSKSAFPHLANSEKRAPEEWEKSCLQVAQELYGEPEVRTGSHSIEQFLGREEAANLMVAELEAHATQQNWDQYATLEMWKGNVGQALKAVVSNGLLDANWVAFSMLAGREVWESMCVLYAKQLELKSQPHMAALYYLSCHKVREAVEVYKKAMLFRDAVMLAKTRFATCDPIISEVYMAWGQHQEKSGNFVPSAMCYLAARHPSEAIQMLASRAGPEYLSLAAKLARVCHDPLSQALSIAHGMRSQGLGEWNTAKEEFSAHEDLKIYLFILGVEKAWVNYNSQLAPGGSKFPRIEQMADLDDLQLFPKIAGLYKATDSNTITYETKVALNFYMTVSKFWRQSFGDSLDDASCLSTYYQKLLTSEPNPQLRKEKREQFLISYKLTLALLSQLLPDPSPCPSHYLDAVAEQNKNSASSLVPVLLLVLPFGDSSCAALRSFRQSQVVDNLWAFYKFGELDKAARDGSTVGSGQVEEYISTLLVKQHTELQNLKQQETQLTAKIAEGDLALKRAKGSKSAKKGKSGKTNELKTELIGLRDQLTTVQTALEKLEKQPKFPNPEKASQILATLCTVHPSLSKYIPTILEFGTAHAYDDSDTQFWTKFTSSTPTFTPTPTPTPTPISTPTTSSTASISTPTPPSDGSNTTISNFSNENNTPPQSTPSESHNITSSNLR